MQRIVVVGGFAGAILAHRLSGRLASIRGGEVRAFRYRPRGSMAPIGHMRGVADVFGRKLTGLRAWLLWRAYYLSQMPTAGRKLRIFVECTWGMLFPTDITHIRFARSAEDAPAAAREPARPELAA